MGGYLNESQGLKELYSYLQNSNGMEKEAYEVVKKLLLNNSSIKFNLNKALNIKKIAVNTFLLSCLNELTLIAIDYNQKTNEIVDPSTLKDLNPEKADKINNLINLTSQLLDYTDYDSIWMQKSNDSCIALKLYEVCSIMLFADGYTVLSDRRQAFPKSPIEINKQSLWTRPKHSHDELSESYMLEIENRNLILQLISKLIKKCHTPNKMYQNPASYLFSHRLSKNINNFIFSAIYMIYSDFNEMMKLGNENLISTLKHFCTIILGQFLANSFLSLGNDNVDKIVSKYFNDKKEFLKITNIDNELVYPTNLALRILSNCKLEIVDLLFKFCNNSLPLYNISLYEGLDKTKLTDLQKLENINLSIYMSHLFFINFLIIRYNSSSREFSSSSFISHLFEDTTFFLNHHNITLFGPSLDFFALCLCLQISVLREAVIKASITSSKYSNQTGKHKELNNSISFIIYKLIQLFKKDAKDRAHLQILIGCLYNLSPYLRDISSKNSKRLIKILKILTKEKWVNQGKEFQRMTYLFIASLALTITFNSSPNDILINQLILNPQLCYSCKFAGESQFEEYANFLTKNEKDLGILNATDNTINPNNEDKKELNLTTNFQNYVYFLAENTKINVFMTHQSLSNTSENQFWEENKNVIAFTFTKLFNFSHALSKENDHSLSNIRHDKLLNQNDLLILLSELSNSKYPIKSKTLTLDKEFEKYQAKEIMNIQIN